MKRTARRATQWALLFALWIALSGVMVLEFLILGALSAAVGVVFSERLFSGTHEGWFAPAPSSFGWYVRTTLRFALYIPWLSWQIVLSNLHVVYLVLHPRMPIHPTLVEFQTTLVSERAQVTLAQSITLTPGTVTVDAFNGTFLIHCLSDTTRQGIADGVLQKKIAQVFGEPWEDKVELKDIVTPEQVPM
jgi:multicomponent Na+:H+ antiporter subunit E